MAATDPQTPSTGRNRDGGRRPIPVPPVPLLLPRHDEEEAAEPDDDEPELELTLRAVLGGIMVGGILCFSNMYFGLQTGWVTMGSLQSALLGYGLFSVGASWFPSMLLPPLTAKENVVLQTTAVAAATMPLAAGFVGIIPALGLLRNTTTATMTEEAAGAVAVLDEGGYTFTVLQLFGWCVALGFFGVFMAPPLRQQTILREQLPFPSGTATAEIIRQLHGLPPPASPSSVGHNHNHSHNNNKLGQIHEKSSSSSSSSCMGSKDEMTPLIASTTSSSSVLPIHQQPQPIPPAWRLLFCSFAISAAYTIIGENFIPIIRNVPLGTYLGYPVLTAWSWTVQPSPSYFGQGLIMGPKTAVSMFLGTLVGWGLLAPMAHAKGWTTGPIKDVGTGPTGWLLWISLAIMLADSVVSLSVVLIKILRPQMALSSSISKRRSDNENSNNTNNDGSIEDDDTAVDPAPLDQQISWRIWLPGLVVASLVCTGILTPMFAMPPWQPAFAVLFSLLVAVLAIRALGETDLNPVSGIGKVSQLLFAVVAPGNLVANLVAGAVAEAGAMAAGDMMQDLKCGHLLFASPKAQFVGQLVGTGAGCVMVVAAWMLYSTAYDIPGKEFPSPTTFVWLSMAEVVNGGGIDLTAMHVVPTALVAAGITILLPILEATIIPTHRSWMVPSAMAAAIGMYVTPNWTLPRVAGGIANYLWHRWNPEGATNHMIVLASGFVLGEGIASILNAAVKGAGIINSSWVLCWGCPAGFCTGCS